MASASGKAGGKWIPPLPHGWEGRYDEENKAYFFIDHIHKRTQWEDPRFHKVAPHAQSQAPATSAAAATSLGLSGGPVRSHGAIDLQDLKSHQHPEDRSRSSRSNVHEASLTNEVDHALVKKLMADFPHANKELITDILAICHNNERETREQLNDLGFLASVPKGKNSNHASPHHATSHHATPHHATSGGAAPTKKSSDPHPTAAATVSKSELSEGEKQRLLYQAKSLFPKLDPEVVRLALNECHYDVEQVKVLLTAWEKHENNQQAKTTNARSADSSAGSSVPSSRPFSPPAMTGSLEPVGFDDAAAYKPKNFGNSQPSAPSSGQSMSPKQNTTSTHATSSLTQNAKGDTVSSSKSSCSQHARAKQVTKPKQEGTVNHPSVVTSQPAVEQKSKVTSQYRTEPKGPDSSLRKGPDSSLLTSDYTQANGPDKSLRLGPDHSHLTGPQRAAGPDVTLRCGPQSALLEENRNNNVATTSAMLFGHG